LDLCDPVLESQSMDFFFVLAISESAFESDELVLLEVLANLERFAPGMDAMPFCADLVLAFVVLPALDAEV
jgi:hypothetical protein